MSDNKKVLDEIGTQFNIDKVKSELKDRPKVWEGKQEVWEALPDTEKEKWDYANFTDDSDIAIVTDDCEPDNPNAISSKGVYDHALIRVTHLPENPSEGDTVLYMGQNTYTYNAVTTQGTENPQNEGWYERNGTDYVLTEDTSITVGKTYYERIRGLVSGGIYEYDETLTEWVLKSAETTPQITLDDTLDENSNNAVKNSAITTEVNKRLVVTDTMPTASADLLGQTRLYIGSTTTNYQEGGIYKCESDGQTPPTYSWNIKNKADIDLSLYKKIFTGTQATWNTLTDAQKKEYDIANITDDTEDSVVDEVVDGDMRAVTSNAVADALANKIDARINLSSEIGQQLTIPTKYTDSQLRGIYRVILSAPTQDSDKWNIGYAVLWVIDNTGYTRINFQSVAVNSNFTCTVSSSAHRVISYTLPSGYYGRIQLEKIGNL